MACVALVAVNEPMLIAAVLGRGPCSAAKAYTTDPANMKDGCMEVLLGHAGVRCDPTIVVPNMEDLLTHAAKSIKELGKEFTMFKEGRDRFSEFHHIAPQLSDPATHIYNWKRNADGSYVDVTTVPRLLQNTVRELSPSLPSLSFYFLSPLPRSYSIQKGIEHYLCGLSSTLLDPLVALVLHRLETC